MPAKKQNLRQSLELSRLPIGTLALVEGLWTDLSLAPNPSPPPVPHRHWPPHPPSPALQFGTPCTSASTQQSPAKSGSPPSGSRGLSALQQPSPFPPGVVPLSQTIVQTLAGPTLCASPATFQILWSGPWSSRHRHLQTPSGAGQ